MKWIRERDALIAQTLAFVQSVTGRKDEFARPDDDAVAAGGTMQVTTVEVASILAVEGTLGIDRRPEPTVAPPPPFKVAPPRAAGEFRSEIQSRVANFRKHQERFEREREEYYAATLAKARDGIRDVPPSRPPAGK
jgi:hypothetical protein